MFGCLDSIEFELTGLAIHSFTALLPKQAKTSSDWPELVWPRGVHQPKETGPQSGGRVHRPRQGWQGRPSG